MKTRCAYLNQDGIQCERSAMDVRAMHLDGEIYGWTHDPDVPDTDIRTLSTWVAAPLCEPHATAFKDSSSEVLNGRVVD